MKTLRFLLAAVPLTVITLPACRSKEGAGYDEKKSTHFAADNGGGAATSPSAAAATGNASNGGAATGGDTGGAAVPAAPPAVRTLDEPKKDDPRQGQPEKSALPKNLEPDRKP